MRAVWTLLKKELKVTFVTPLAYVFLGVFLFLAGLFFYLGIVMTGEASLRVMIGNLAIALLFVLPMLTMRHFAEESRSGTFELLMTSPLSPVALILGKWLSSLVLTTMMLAGTLIFPLVLEFYGDPDWGVVFTSYIGLWLTCAAFTAAGLFASSLSNDQVAAGMGGIVLLLPFWLIGNADTLVGSGAQEWLDKLALLPHLRGFTRGVVDTADVAYFVAFAFVFLFLTYRTLESRRWR
ncbi:MAG: ABC transporter permease [Myxococcota bacterium]|nr:ABC transporter permease [Myxococcota bacterium]